MGGYWFVCPVPGMWAYVLVCVFSLGSDMLSAF